MMNLRWIKHFQNGPLVSNLDEQSSWRNSRLEGMVGTTCFYKKHEIIEIIGHGNYWQSEDYEVEFGKSVPTLITLRLQKQINPQDKFFSSNRSKNSQQYFDVVVFLSDAYRSVHIYPIDTKNINQWYTIEYDIQSQKFKHYFANDKI